MTEQLKLSDELAIKRTELAAQRTIMAADRSLMAWVRTGLSLIGFGFTIYAFLQSMMEKTSLTILSAEGPRRIGLFLLAIGIVSIVLGVIQDWATVKGIHKVYKVSTWRFPLVIAGLVGLLGILLFILVIIRVHLL